MMKATILSLDVGTSVTKAVLFDLKGCELAVAESGYRLATPQPGWAELDPQEIWHAVMQVLQAILGKINQDAEILAIALSTQGGTLIPVGDDGTPTTNAITWLDQRSVDVVKDWQTRGCDRWIRVHSGWGPQPGLPLASICALRRHQPEVFSSTKRFLSVNDYLVYRLTGTYCTNPSMAGEMLLTDIKTGEYDPDLCDLAGVFPWQLSPICSSEAVCGEIKPGICRQLGLAIGTPLVNGGQDHSCEALALGMVDPGSYMLACGTAWVLNGITDTPEVKAFPPQMALNYHVIPGRWIASQYLGGFGAGMEWWLDQFWQVSNPGAPKTRQDRFASFNLALAQTLPGSSGVIYLPVSGTPQSGLTAGGYWGLRLDHSRADLGRAVMESAAYALRHTLADVRDFGLPVNQLWMIGGAAHSPIWPQIVADVCNLPILLTQYRHGPALGAAILAAKGLDILDAYPSWVSPHKIGPDPENISVYTDMYEAYLEVTRKFLQ